MSSVVRKAAASFMFFHMGASPMRPARRLLDSQDGLGLPLGGKRVTTRPGKPLVLEGLLARLGRGHDGRAAEAQFAPRI